MSEAMAEGGGQPRLEIASRRGEPIRTLDEWQEFAPPARALQWNEGRSAMELARLWLRGEGARLTSALLSGHPPLAGLVVDRATAEAQVAFDEHRGGRRNHDLSWWVAPIGGRLGSSVRKPVLYPLSYEGARGPG